VPSERNRLVATAVPSWRTTREPRASAGAGSRGRGEEGAAYITRWILRSDLGIGLRWGSIHARSGERVVTIILDTTTLAAGIR
jgi:hypothetical protein